MKVNNRPLLTLTALAMLLVALVVGVRAQGGGSAPAPVAGKTGVLNVRQAIITTAEGKQASADLQSQFSSRQNELENLRKQIEDLQKRLSAIGNTGSEDEKARLQRQGESLSRQFQRKQDELTEDLNNAQGEVIDRIGRKMIDVLDRYSRENGYTVVFDTSAQNSPVLYASSQIDVTQDIIRLYDQAYPVKGGAPTAAPPRQQPPATGPRPQPPGPGTTPPKPQQPTPKPPAQKPPQQ